MSLAVAATATSASNVAGSLLAASRVSSSDRSDDVTEVTATPTMVDTAAATARPATYVVTRRRGRDAAIVRATILSVVVTVS